MFEALLDNSNAPPLRAFRMGLNLSVRDLANRAGLTDQVIFEVENEKRAASEKELAAIAEVLNLVPANLLEWLDTIRCD